MVADCAIPKTKNDYITVTLHNDSAGDPERSFPRKAGKVLLVDESRFNLGILSDLLKERWIDVDTAESGLECLRKAIVKEYDLIIINVCMPNINGSVTIKELRQNEILQDKTTVVALSSNTDEDSLRRYMDYGFDDFLARPVKIDMLDTILAKYLPRISVAGKDML